MNRPYSWQAIRRFLIVLLAFMAAVKGHAQCSNWSISAQVTTASTCASNGTFAATLNGPDVANLSNIQYGIPIATNGFSVPLNSSPNFAGIPPGTYQVSAVATCGGATVGRTTSITIPGSYTAPAIYSTSTRASLNCAFTGRLNVGVGNGVLPITYNIISHPVAYLGPLSATLNSRSCAFNNLPPGVYTIQAVDACLTGTVPKTDTVRSLNPANAQFIVPGTGAKGCDTLIVYAPAINENLGGWAGYGWDTAFKVSVQVSGGIAVASSFVRMPDSFVAIKLTTGKTIKDCYGKTITYTIKPPCGSNISITQSIPYPALVSNIMQHCNTDFSAELSLSSIACLPITYTLHSNTTNVNYGPYTASSNSFSPPNLPLGIYSVSFTTGDGYTGSGSIGTSTVTGNPYSVSVLNGAYGLNNYIAGFQFTTSTTSVGGIKLVELFSGPAGYTYQDYWYDALPYNVYSNANPTATALKFPPGTYVWKITDDCGDYFLTVTVPSSALYQFTVGTPATLQTCQGLWITPTGTAANGSVSVPVGFSMLRNGLPVTTIVGGRSVWPVYPLGTPILLTQPGTYTIVPTASITAINLTGYYYPGGFTLGYPNSYTASYTFTYNQLPLAVDVNATQGFLCQGAAAGNGQIYVKGMNGIPFYSPPSPHYNYSLALPGNGATGPYIANNNTGVFAGFGGNAGAFYDVKVEDTCGAFAVQRIKILDLSTTRLISSTSYVACLGNTVQLSAIYLPNAAYTWTGPNGFSSTSRQPVITNVGVLNIGIYRVTITTAQCNSPVGDSTILTVAGNPPRPLISYQCNPRPIAIQVTNASAGLVYKWDYGYPLVTTTGFYYAHGPLVKSDTLLKKYVFIGGSYAAVAVDTLTGCTTTSDSLLLADPYDTLRATIYSPHLQLCTGDTTTLVAGGYGSSLNVSFQWYRNGTPIAGATNSTYIASVAGSYRVLIDAGPCNVDTSAAATVTIVSPPTASITSPALSLCAGDTVTLQATTGNGYSYTYTWQQNGTTIPGAFSSSYKVTTAGSYTVVISNGACVATAAPVSITVNQPPLVNLNLSGTQKICAGSSVTLTTPAGNGYGYTWNYNGIVIPGATTNSYLATAAGSYQVVVSTALCPSVSSSPVHLQVLPVGVNLGPDTTNCRQPGALLIPLSVDTGFTQILWSTGQSTPAITVYSPGIYWVKASDQCGTFSDSMRIYDLSEFLPHLPDDTTICNAGGGRLSVPSLLKDIRWNTGATTASISVDSPGTYWVEGQSPCGPLYDTVSVHFCAPVITGLKLSADSICEGSCITVNAVVENYSKKYSWHFAGGAPQASTLASPGAVCYGRAGIYPVTLIVQNAGGADTAETYVVVSAKPVPRFKDTSITVPYKTLLRMSACADAQRADWYLGDSLVCAACPEMKIEARYYQSVYRCVVRNGDCADSCSYALRVVDIPNDLWLPDAFTPNGDGRNDIFRVITDNPNIQVINLDVYNRWGQRVFVSNRNNGGWDGTLHGQPAESGNYFWQLRYRVLGGKDEVFSRKGDVLLIR